MSRFTPRTRFTFISILLTSVLIIAVITSYVVHAESRPVQATFNHFLSTNYDGDAQFDDNGPPGALLSGPEQERYSDRAYPQQYVASAQAVGAYQAYQSMARHPWVSQGQSWHLIGPTTGTSPAPVTYTGRATTVSGRVTAIAVSDSCDQNICRVWVGAAGGGVWVTNDGLDP